MNRMPYNWRAGRPRSIFANRRGATSVEYAIMLVFIILAVGLAFRSIGVKMKRAGNETVQNFDGNAGGGGAGAGAAGAGAAGAKAGGKNGKGGSGGSGDGTGAANGDRAKSGGGTAAASGGGGGSNVEQNGSISDAPRQDEESTGPSYTRILAIVFMILFALTAFFAFRKGKSQASG